MDRPPVSPAIDSKGFFIRSTARTSWATAKSSFGLVLDYGHNIPAHADNGHADRIGHGHGVRRANTSHRHRDRPARVRKTLVANSFQGTSASATAIANKAIVGITIPVNLMAGDEALRHRSNGGQYNSDKPRSHEAQLPRCTRQMRLTRVDRGIGLAIDRPSPASRSRDAPKDLGPIRKPGTGRSSCCEKQVRRVTSLSTRLNVATARYGGKNPKFENDITGQSHSPKARSSTQTSARTAFGLCLPRAWIRWI